ncbi:MAG: hypothetical protein V9G19_03725 [Tetrasphaera sp.]
MGPLSPTDALGPHAGPVRELLARVVRDRHDRAADAHQVSESRYASGFGTQWRDLLDDTRDALTERGFQSHKLVPGGYALPVVNDSLIYVWRVPNSPGAISSFASSPTRQSGFSALPPDPMLFEPELTHGLGSDDEVDAETEFERVLRTSIGGAMPLVLVLVESSPRQLHSIDWAIAVMDAAGKVALLGRESIWVAETIGDGTNAEVDAFDSGIPPGPRIEPREEEGSGPDA